MTPSIEALLAELERLPAVTLDIDAACRTGSVRAGGQVVARVELRHERVLVNAPAGFIATLQRVFPSSLPTADGIAFDLAVTGSSTEALVAIRRRVQVQQFLWQLRSASP
jgi:hypothetical protein